MDHSWPPELDAKALCYNCGLQYDEWTDPETLHCELDIL